MLCPLRAADLPETDSQKRTARKRPNYNYVVILMPHRQTTRRTFYSPLPRRGVKGVRLLRFSFYSLFPSFGNTTTG